MCGEVRHKLLDFGLIPTLNDVPLQPGVPQVGPARARSEVTVDQLLSSAADGQMMVGVRARSYPRIVLRALLTL